jgi:hypothetical protein
VGENQQVNAVEIYLVEQFTTMGNLSMGFSSGTGSAVQNQNDKMN